MKLRTLVRSIFIAILAAIEAPHISNQRFQIIGTNYVPVITRFIFHIYIRHIAYVAAGTRHGAKYTETDSATSELMKGDMLA